MIMAMRAVVAGMITISKEREKEKAAAIRRLRLASVVIF